ncbi:MAG: UvrD-helicase domain-containing protein, partial [Solirubrobacteraceae bacterium]
MPADLLARRLCLPGDLPQPVTDWTAQQRLAIERREGDLLLTAAAGSGKTSVLVERFVRSVLEDGVAATAILTITFTDKAAAELRDRIRARFRELGEPEQARRTEGAFISTIHGFCARVLRADAVAAGLAPRFEVLDGDASEALRLAAFEDALAELHRESPAATVALVAAYTAWSLRSTIAGLYGRLRSAGAARPRLPAAPEVTGAQLAAAADELAGAADRVARELGEIPNAGPSVAEALRRAVACAELVGGGDPEALWPPELGAMKLSRNGTALGSDACLAYDEALGVARQLAAANAAAPVRDQLDRLLDLYGERCDALKHAAGAVDFDDLELIARDLLARDAPLRERWSERFERIMVDELQDTNRVQLSLIESLARDNLFTVGDAQQSIYRFRHAEVELFERRADRLAASGGCLALETNFRSRPEILRALNAAFAPELGDRFIPLVPGREQGPSGGEPAVELLVVDKGAEWDLEGVASPWRVAEARTLARRVAELVRDGRAPGEIVVLLRASTDMRAYERALEACGLPTYVIGGRGYWSHPQVVDLVGYLRALANPRDEEALYGVLASPLVGASLDALVILAGAARESKRDPWWLLREPRGECDALAAADRELLERFTAWFGVQRRRAARASLEELIDSALACSGYDLAILASPGGRRRLANVRKLMRLAREHEAAHGPDLRGFLAAIERRVAGVEGAARDGEAPVEGEDLDAIRLMTIHRAKGLEFPVVAVADLGRAARPPSDLVKVGGDGRLGIRLARAGAGERESALHYKALGDEERDASEREERRLFYVATTRARERLLLSGAIRFEGLLGSGGATGGGPIAWIGPSFVPGLGEVLADGGGEVDGGGGRIAVRVGRPGDAGPGPPAAAPGPPGAVGP